MRSCSDDVSALESQILVRAEIAKQAIQAYNRLILCESVAGCTQKLEIQRQVAHAVSQYMQARKKLDELRGQMATDSAR
jgi:hypothetical protein